ncbi:uncharacterized protein DNG_02669 [Cephalotrichum gorgonifer]|uniref:DUF8035 domain-containing protein n=1 Tax=Cephalotrichum gorgonifer TaxID=2041049 RepID=A0AAE8STA1_9PEZI|nr:uncharacterized protein DNG_02669 [Cephalotrichum gorgonifer]
MAYFRDGRERSRSRGFVREQERSPSRDRTPAFLRDREIRRADAGPLVLRQREVETVSRPHRHRSPSPVYVERQQLVRRSSPSPPRGRSVSQVRMRTVQRDVSVESSASSSSYSSYESAPRRGVFRRPRSVSPDWRETERERETIRTRIRRESPSPAPPQPQVVRGPTIEREVVTHYTDIDHGVIRARQPSPLPPAIPRSKSRARHKDTEIDIITSRNETEVDIHRTEGHSRARSRSRPRAREREYATQDRLVVAEHKPRRRAYSAAPLPVRDPVREEAEYLASKIDSRGRHGEAYHGVTRDWIIVDVPPGTERIRMDGVGGGSTETTFQRYSGVRRTQFIPEREEEPIVEILPAPEQPPRKSRDRLSIHVSDRDRELDVTKVTDRRVAVRPKEPPMETWTEITRDLVNKEALRRKGYMFEENGQFYYVMQYLSSREIDELVELTDTIRRSRRLKKRQQLPRDRDVDRELVIHTHRHRHRHGSPHRFRHELERERQHRDRYEDLRFEKQVSFERRRDHY